MDKKKAIIFGIDSDIGNKTAEIFKSKNYEIIGFSKNFSSQVKLSTNQILNSK